jgi:hypothetical protein
MSKRTFEQWKDEVDAHLLNMIGVNSDDIPDYDYYTDYTDGIAPARTARRAYKAAEEF